MAASAIPRKRPDKKMTESRNICIASFGFAFWFVFEELLLKDRVCAGAEAAAADGAGLVPEPLFSGRMAAWFGSESIDPVVSVSDTGVLHCSK